ncbi:MAG TPA: polyprenyl diphosphate synthase [Gammaproteobacteria bacterium]|nr:polyprenyl diphosphate synthase [Gammaproteobacteria bacterium]
MLPKHIAIVMDGNGRWAERRNQSRMSGHEAGVKAVEKVIKAAIEKNIKVVTLFAFGIENWGRPAQEVKFLMRLFIKNLYNQSEEFVKNNIQLRVIGDRDRIDPKLQDKINQVQQLTAKNTGLTLIIAFNYSGRWDILQAVRCISQKVQNGEFTTEEISYQHIQDALCLSDLPEPDLFIRTSGELRISNFMLWQFAYTELYFTEVLWPDFDEVTLEEALRVFSLRQRRYGLTGKQIKKATVN